MKKNKFAQNAAFFNQAKGGGDDNFVLGGEPPKNKGGEAIEIAAGAGVGSGGTISEKGLINAFKRAKQSGSFIV